MVADVAGPVEQAVALVPRVQPRAVELRVFDHDELPVPQGVHANLLLRVVLPHDDVGHVRLARGALTQQLREARQGEGIVDREDMEVLHPPLLELGQHPALVEGAEHPAVPVRPRRDLPGSLQEDRPLVGEQRQRALLEEAHRNAGEAKVLIRLEMRDRLGMVRRRRHHEEGYALAAGELAEFACPVREQAEERQLAREPDVERALGPREAEPRALSPAEDADARLVVAQYLARTLR